MKEGSGSLDFTEETDESSDKSNAEEDEKSEQRNNEEVSVSDSPSSGEKHSSNTPTKHDSEAQFPYFVRRSNVGDERNNRFEIHTREKVVNQEQDYRSELADELGVTEVSKTDAREFALLAAYHNPETVAEFMREEGFDLV